MANDLIKKGYREVADNYVAKRDQFESNKYLEKFTTFIDRGKTILDVGCGAGKPVDAYLVNQGYAVNGIDISPRMIALAKENVPDAFYEIKDMSELKDGEYCVNGIVAFYSIFHTPRGKHQELLHMFASFMPNGGPLLITMSVRSREDREDDFHGEKMFWRHYGADKNTELVVYAGFTIVLNEIDTSANEKHQIILAQLG